MLLTPTHTIPGLPSWHPCANIHGHTYTVTLILETTPHDGAVVPADLSDVDAWARDLSGQHLNELMATPPTEEHIAIWIHDTWKPTYPQLASVAISSGSGRAEDPHPRLEYRPGGARPGHFLIDEDRHMTVPIGWDDKPIYPADDDAVGARAAG